MTGTIAVFGGSFNPPGRHHREIAARLAEQFDRVAIVPCGPRPDKPITDDVLPTYRAAMADLTFRGMPKVQVDLFDLETASFTRTYQLEERYRSAGEVWHVVGTDLLCGGGASTSVIHEEWARGAEIWQQLHFAIVPRTGYACPRAELPPHHRLLGDPLGGSSSEIRDAVFHRRPFDEWVTPEVWEYIERHNLYRGMRPAHRTRLALPEIRPLLVTDPSSSEARRVAAELGAHELVEEQQLAQAEQANLIVVIGGDGTMLRAIRSHWRLRLPFYGVNVGHVGFLLNQAPPVRYHGEGLVLEQLPLLWVQVEGADGVRREALAFNDAWVERASGQTAWLQVTVDGRQRLDPLVADGALLATAAGSTCYARAMGAAPLPLNTPALMLVGSNVLRPAFFRPAVLPVESTVELRTLDPSKRPLRGYIDGVDQGEVHALRARVSNIATVELAFDPRFDAAEKLARLQFPPALDPID